MAGREHTGSSSDSCRYHHRKSCDEIIKLDAELRNAYTLKNLKNQIAEKNANSLSEEIRQKFEDKMTISNINVEMKKESEDRKKNYLQTCEKYKNELENQIKLKQEEKEKVKEDERKERIVLHELDRIQDAEEEFKKLTNKYELRESIERNCLIQMEANEILKMKKEDLDKEDDEKVRKYLELLKQRSLLFKKQEDEKIRKREKATSLVAGMIISAESSKQNREALIFDLVTEEIQHHKLMREKEEYLKRIREKDELKKTLDKQILFNEECKRRFVERDRDFAEAVMKRILEDERIERLTLDARKRRSLKYREDLLKLIEDKKLLRDKEIIRLQKELESEHLQETMMIESIRDERISLLQQHKENVAEFINKSELTKEEQKILAMYSEEP